jgi:hypothetical protein
MVPAGTDQTSFLMVVQIEGVDGFPMASRRTGPEDPFARKRTVRNENTDGPTEGREIMMGRTEQRR